MVDAVRASVEHFDVGARLKQIREAHGLSQRELARRTGLTNGAISLIEQNKSSPSVASLKKILLAIPISLAEFFAGPIPAGGQVFFKAEELVPLTRGELSLRQVGNMAHHSLQVLHERYQPGADTGEAMLAHPSEEGGVVIAGEIELTVGELCQVLGPGDAYLFDSRIPHRFRNLGEVEAQIISACTPPYL